MKEHPILFSTPMVNAILDGRKTQTRRVFKGLPELSPGFEWNIEPTINGEWEVGAVNHITGEEALLGYFECKHGGIGDRLWVRETWADVNTPDGPAICYRADGNYMHWRDFSKTFGPDYGIGPSMDYTAYPGGCCMWWEDLLNGEPDHRWRPSIFMPRWASRITLEITGIRVERLQDITEEDAIAEGVFGNEGPYDQQTPRMCFETLWDSINGKKYPWSINPWVWVISFERIK